MAIAERLDRLIRGGHFLIASKKVIGKGEGPEVEAKKPMMDATWIGTRVLDLATVMVADYDDDNEIVSYCHRVDAGAFDVGKNADLMDIFRKAILSTGGWDGRNADSRMGPIYGDESTHFHSTKKPKKGTESLSECLEHLCGSVDPTTLHKRALSKNGLLRMFGGLTDDLTDGCLQLIPKESRDQLVEDKFTVLLGSGVLRTLPDPSNYAGPFTCQVWHTDHEWAFYAKLAEHGVFGFIVSIPLTDEGCFLKVYDKSVRGTDGVFKPNEGKAIFVPFGQAFAQPISSIHSGGIRTGPLGNPRMHIVVFLCNDKNKSAWNKRSFFPPEYVTHWLSAPDGDDQEGAKSAEGAHVVSHSGRNLRVFSDIGTESRKGICDQHSHYMNEILTLFGW